LDHAVLFAGVRLSGNREETREAQFGRNTLLEFPNLVVVAFEEVNEGCLGSGGALAATKPEPIEPLAQDLHIECEVLHPQHGSLANGGQLRRLKMGDVPAGVSGNCA
jgi:hypothetical protein